MPAGFGGGTNEEEQGEQLKKQSHEQGEAIRKFRLGQDPGGGTSGGYEGLLKKEEREKAYREGQKEARKGLEARLRTGRKQYKAGGGKFYTGGQGKGPPVQKIVVQQQPPKPQWSGPPLPPIKIAGRPLPGASNAVFVLGLGLVAVAGWQPFIKPLLGQLWGAVPGQPPPPKTTWPGGAIVALPVFVLFLVFIASLSPGAAQAVLWFIVALWIVFLVMNPGLVQGAMAFFTQRNPATNSVAPTVPPTTTTGGTVGGSGGGHVK